MFSKASSALTALVFLQQWSSSLAQSSSSTYSADLTVSTACPSEGGAHIIVSRGSLEAPPYGVLVSVKDNILSQVPGSTAEGTIGYPDTLNDYDESESDGVIAARGYINSYVSRCPGLPMVLMGYSQGANVLGDALVGQMDRNLADNTTIDQPLSDQVLSQVAAVIFMGDPTFVVSEAFHVGNATKNGSFPRQNAALFDTTGLTPKTQSYCDANDLFCAGGTSIAVHVGYVPEYGTAAATFVVKQIAAWYENHGSTGSNSTATAVIPVTASKTGYSASTQTTVAPYGSSGMAANPTKLSACKSAASATGRRSASASASLASPSMMPSNTQSASPSGYTGAASSINVGSAAGVGAVVAGLFAALL